MLEVVRVDESQDWSRHPVEDGDSLFTLLDSCDGTQTEFARINADGTCVFNWESIARAAARWEPWCSNMVTICAKLLHEAKQQGEIRG